MRRRRLLAIGPPALLAGCARRHAAPPAVAVRYVVGAAYQAGGVWRYPHARFAFEETGLAAIIGAHPPTCTDGAPCDPDALVAAHPTLQLPCVARVSNLETGRAVVLRIDDRGPASPARSCAVSPRAATLLGPASTPGVIRVRLQVLEAESRALADALGGSDAPFLAVSAAPPGDVRMAPLAPPAGIAASPGASLPALPQAGAAASEPARGAPVPLRLPERVEQGPAEPGELFIDCGAFTGRRYASLLARRIAALGAAITTSGAVADQPYRVRIGPLADVAQADATLDRTLAAGVVDARIVVEQG